MQQTRQAPYAPPPDSAGAPQLYNLNAEMSVLGSILISPDMYYPVAALITPKDFYRQSHGWVFEAFDELIRKGMAIDATTVQDELERKGQLQEAGGTAFITSLWMDSPTALYAVDYARLVAEYSARRRLLVVAGYAAEQAYDPNVDLISALNEIDRRLDGITTANATDIIPIADSIRAVMDKIAQLQETPDLLIGIPTGYVMLDKMLAGLQKSDLIIVAGRPSMGKTSLSLNIVYNAASRFGISVGIFSLEMSAEQLTQRLLSMESLIDLTRIRTGAILEEENDILLRAAGALDRTPITIIDRPGATISEIRSIARSLQRDGKLDLLLIDYMQLIGGTDDSDRQKAISYISRSLKLLARELNIPVIAVSQLSRNVESRADKRPILSDLRDSGAIEQDSDVVLFLYRDDYYNENSDRAGLVEVNCAKHRQGATGTITLYNNRRLALFKDMQLGDAE